MDQAKVQELDVHKGLDNTLLILKYKLKKKNITITRDYAESLPKIKAYGSELNQVWTNLIVNAVDAMSEGGKLKVRTKREPTDILVEIRDNGAGIPAAVRSRIFEPFFTTKPVGEGTGLGLDTVARIVRKHRGNVRFESKPGDTCFQVRLPMVRSALSAFICGLTLHRGKLFRVCTGFRSAGDSHRAGGSRGKHSSYPELDDD